MCDDMKSRRVHLIDVICKHSDIKAVHRNIYNCGIIGVVRVVGGRQNLRVVNLPFPGHSNSMSV